MKLPNLPPAPQGRKKKKMFTSKQLYRTRQQRERERREAEKAAKALRRSIEQRQRRELEAFRGIPPESTLALIGEEV